jgi:hypothetical protein
MTSPTIGDTALEASRTWAVVGRWMLGFVGFPIGGLLALSTVGAIDSTATAFAGGALSGAVLGAAHSLAAPQLPRLSWIAATTIGMSVGLALGATAVDFDTSLGALGRQGAVNGAVIGIAQAIVLARRTDLTHWKAAAWTPFLAMSWALGWTITSSAGVDVDRQYTVFGATGAIVVTALTVILPLSLRRH